MGKSFERGILGGFAVQDTPNSTLLPRLAEKEGRGRSDKP